MVALRASSTPDLVNAAKAGDVTAFETLMRAHADAVYGHALRFFGDPHAAEDVVQEVFLKVYRSIDSFDEKSAFSTWLFRVTRNVCLDLFRAGRRRPVPVDPVDIVGGSSPDPAQAIVDMATVEQAMRALHPEDREALSAISLFGLTYPEAATELGIPVGTVKSRVFRARRTLLSMLGMAGGERA
jgi:RNA polymerase sigma-70 factor (ECF subfamily)